MHLRGLIFLLLGALCMAAVHNLAFQYFWYWQYWWLDLLMHAAGGAFIAGTSIVAAARLRLHEVVILALSIGIVWELFELWAGVPQSPSFALDTSLDLLFDALGAALLFGIIDWWHSPSQSSLLAGRAE